MNDFEVNGADQFLRLSKALKAAGRKEMRRDLNTGLRRAAKPLVGQTRAAARRTLPRRGGLAASVAKAPQRVRVRTGAQSAGVSLVVGKKAGTGARGANRGVIRHPVFGQDVWVNQKVRPGWFDDTIRREAPAIRRELEKSLEETIRNIIRGG